MKIPSILTCALLSAIGASVCHRAEAQGTSEPAIKFENQIYDFGKVKSGEVVKHSFIFTNTGTSTLDILQVKPGCGCTTAGTWDTKVEPGKTGSIPLQFNSTGFGGKVSKSATVTSNDPKQSNVVLQITGTIWRPIDYSPTMAVFNVPAEGQPSETRTIRITSNVDEPITLEPPILNSSSFKAELKTIKEGKEFDLVVTSIPPFTNNYTSAPIKIKTSSKEMAEINTTAYVSVLPALSIIPQILTLPAGPVAANYRPAITVRNNTTNNVVLSDAAISIPGASVQLQPVQAGKSYNLLLTFPAAFESTPGQKMEVTVKTSSPKNPVLTIPVTQIMAKPAQKLSSAGPAK